jgi:hypothetical protein
MEGFKYFILFFIFIQNLYLNLILNIYESILPLLLTIIPKEKLNIITGNMLGDGSISYKKVFENGKIKGNAKYGMTMVTYSLNYLNHLYERVYKEFCSTGIRAYPNILLPKKKKL